MADGQQQQQPPTRMQAAFPTPPPFYKHFTKQALSQVRKARKEAGITSLDNDSAETSDSLPTEERKHLDILSLAPELRYLIPPPPPAPTEQWRSFGRTHSLNAPDPTLADLEIEQLYPDHPSVKLNPQAHLIALARSLLTTFLALVGQLAQDPTGYEGRTKDLETIVFNMHDLINRYRPHQARETLIQMMEERMEGLRGETARIREAKGRVEGLLGELQKDVGGGGEEGGVEEKREVTKNNSDARRKARQQAAWAALERSTGSEIK